jgi:UDP-MurNAc hydroxylase
MVDRNLNTSPQSQSLKLPRRHEDHRHRPRGIVHRNGEGKRALRPVALSRLLRFLVRFPGQQQYNEYVFAFFKCLSRAHVQRRCPHLKADLSRFGTVCDGVLECAMHGWRFELASGRCLTADGDDIVAIAVEDSD